MKLTQNLKHSNLTFVVFCVPQARMDTNIPSHRFIFILFLFIFQYAIKTIRKNKINKQDDLTKIQREIEIMATLSHPHIISVHEGKVKFLCQFTPPCDSWCDSKQQLLDGMLFTFNYRPKMKLRKGNVFTGVCLSTRWATFPQCKGAGRPLYNQTPSPRDTVNKRSVGILLECILVK